MLKAVIFDMDDTIIDWSQRAVSWQDFDREHLRGVFKYVNAESPLIPDFETLYQEWHTRSTHAWTKAQETLRAIAIGEELADSLEALGVPQKLLDAEACLEAYGWILFPGVVAFPETVEVLTDLRAHGLKTGLVTNAFQPMWMRERELRIIGISPDLFDCRISSADFGYLKPHPSIFEHALAELGVTAQEAVFVGDNLQADVAGAQNTGIYAIWRETNHASRENREGVTPDSIITDLRQLPAVLDKAFPKWHNDGH